MSKFPLFLAAAAVVSCTHSIPAPARVLNHNVAAYRLAFDNGMHVYVAPDPTSNLVEVDLRVWAGALDEPTGKAGLAHLVEHAALELAPMGRRAVDELAAVALDWNAYTGADHTHYRALVLADDVAAVLRLYGELLRDEREGLTAALFPAGHPYGHGLAGTPAGVGALTRDDFCRFLATQYDPARAAVVVTGAITLEHTVNLADAMLRPLASRTPPTRPHVPPLAPGARKARWSRPNPAVALAFPIPARFTDLSPAVDLLALAGEAALAEQRQKDARLTRTFVLPAGGEATRTLVFVAEYAEPAARDAVVAALWNGVDATSGIAAHPFVEQRLRQRLRLATLERMEPLATRGLAYADYLLAPAGYGAFQGDLARIDNLDPATLRNVARQLFRVDQALLVDLAPTRDSPTEPFVPGARLALRDDFVGAPGLPPPDDLLARRGAALPVREATLSNGLRVVMVPSSLLPVVDIRLVLPVGNVDAPAAAPYSAVLAAHVATPRFTETSVESLTRAVFAGIDLDAHVDERTTVFAVRGLSIYSDFALTILRSLVTDSEYRQSAVDDLRRAYEKARAARAPVARAWSRLAEQLVGTCPALDADADLLDLDARKLTRFSRRHYVPDGATVIVTGMFDPDFVLTQIQAAFSRWTGARRSTAPVAAAHAPTAPAPRAERIAVETVAELRQVYLRIGLLVPADVSPDGVSLAFLRELVAAELRALRDRTGATYTFDVSLARTCGRDMLVLTGDVEAARADLVARTLADGLAGLRTGRDFPQKFARARQAVVRDLLAEANDSRALGDRLQQQVVRGAAPGALRALAGEAAALSSAHIAGLLRSALNPERTAVLCFGETAAAGRACAAFAPGAP